MGVPKEKILRIHAEEAYDTVRGAEIVGKAVVAAGINCHNWNKGVIWIPL